MPRASSWGESLVCSVRWDSEHGQRVSERWWLQYVTSGQASGLRVQQNRKWCRVGHQARWPVRTLNCVVHVMVHLARVDYFINKTSTRWRSVVCSSLQLLKNSKLSLGLQIFILICCGFILSVCCWLVTAYTVRFLVVSLSLHRASLLWRHELMW